MVQGTVSGVFMITGEPRLPELGSRLWIKTWGSKKVGELSIKTLDTMETPDAVES